MESIRRMSIEARTASMLKVANEYRDGVLSYWEFHEDMDAMNYLYI